MASTTTDIMVLLLVVTTMMTIPITNAHGDGVCMECPCGPGNCDFNSATCCDRFQTRTLHTLHVHVNCSRPGHSRIIDPVGLPYNFLQGSGNCSGFHVVHEHSCLTAIPENSCHYPATRAITLSNNALSEFPNMHCLAKLGKLDLRYNRLQSVPHEAFKDLMYLREVYLDYNHITYIHPKVFDTDLTELSIFSVTHNSLLKLEAWPMALHYPFCFFNFSHNRVNDFTNHAHWKLNTSVVYGPGFVDFTYNNFTEGPEDMMRELGIKGLKELGMFFRWGFDFRHNPFHCDCKYYTIIYWGQKLRKEHLWRDYFNVTCASPPQFNGVPVIDIPLDQLVCNITRDCPRGCHCQNQPSKNGIVIACDNVGMTSLPEVMVDGNNLMLHLADNSLCQLPPREYLTRAKTVDLRGNKLKEIAKNTPHLLRNAEQIDLRHNELHHLPETFQALEPKALLLDLHTLKCSCDLEWFPAWLQHSKDHHLNDITCWKEDGDHVRLITVTRDDLDCNVHPDYNSIHRTSFIVAFVVMMAVASLLVIFRYEALVLAHSCARRCTSRNKKQFPALLKEHRYDVFISLNSNCENDFRWVLEVLVPALDRQGLSYYLPPRDCLPGYVEIDEVTKRLQESAAALVIISRDYLESASCLFQFTQAYSHMVARGHGHLLLIRLSELPRRAVREPRLRAMLTLRMFYTPDPEHLNKALASLTQHQDTEL